MRKPRATPVLLLTLALLGCVVWAVEQGREGGRPTQFGVKDGSVPEDPRDTRRGQEEGYPTWPVNKELPNDTFTFARIRYNSMSHGGRGWGRGNRKWSTDYPDSDMNMSYRLQQLTSLQVNPNGAIVDIDPEQFRHFPFLYMIEVGDIDITDDEAKTMREYMLNGGFIMVDDFWGTREWDNFEVALKQIFPDRKLEEIPLEHEIFHMVFPIKVKPQIPHIRFAEYVINQGITYEFDKPGSEHVHYRGSDPWYFREFSEKYAYPLGINIIFYALTH
ncbi:MAG: transmembrane prediction [Verrucomicrobiales bacterium 32-60-5]|nr:MAG: transmembrane prediction [Verrucomicrobiales bacterium 32-60-5]